MAVRVPFPYSLLSCVTWDTDFRERYLAFGALYRCERQPRLRENCSVSRLRALHEALHYGSNNFPIIQRKAGLPPVSVATLPPERHSQVCNKSEFQYLNILKQNTDLPALITEVI